MTCFMYQVRYGSKFPEIIGAAQDGETLRGQIARPPLLPGYSFYQVVGEPVKIGLLTRRKVAARE